VYVPAVIAVGFYFERWRALATDIAVCGSGIGTFLMALLCTLFLSTYGWIGALLIQADKALFSLSLSLSLSLSITLTPCLAESYFGVFLRLTFIDRQRVIMPIRKRLHVPNSIGHFLGILF